MATAKYTRKTTTAKKVEEVEEPKKPSTKKTSPPKDKKEEIVYGEPVPTSSALELEILRSTTCDSEVV